MINTSRELAVLSEELILAVRVSGIYYKIVIRGKRGKTES
jgi:hypothetical protein